MQVGLKRPRTEDTSVNKLRILIHGTFDLFHLGHMRMLEKCKLAYPGCTLIVGVASDNSSRYPTVMNQDERAAVIADCKWVDQVVKVSSTDLSEEFLQANQINLMLVTYIPEEHPHKHTVQIDPADGFAEGEIRSRILRHANDHALSCLQHGLSPRQLGLSLRKNLSLKGRRYCETAVRRLAALCEAVQTAPTSAVACTSSLFANWIHRFSNTFDYNTSQLRKAVSNSSEYKL